MADVADLEARRVLVGVGGSVAAYKACDVITALRRRGVETRVAMTDAAARFVTPALLRAVSGHRVVAGMWDDTDAEHGMAHLELAAWSEVHAVIAASADLIAKLALGLGGDAVTATALASRAPLLIAPAMEGAMWEHPATQANVATLRSRSVQIVGPVHGRLASGREDTGRMAEPQAIVDAVAQLLG
jgi:phosphopantothenoylcysteine synthetase/decarboxylase